MDNIAQHLELLKLLKGDDTSEATASSDASTNLSDKALNEILSKYEPDVLRVYDAFIADIKLALDKHIGLIEAIDNQAELDIVSARASELNMQDVPNVPKSIVFMTLTAPYLLSRLEEFSADFIMQRLQKHLDDELPKK